MARRQRLIITIYDNDGEVVEGPVGFTSDRACVEIAAGVADRAVGEWRLWKIGRAPDGVRLIRTVQAAGLDKYPHSQTWHPMAEAAMQWANLDLPGKMSAVHDYRTTGSRVIRARTMTPEERIRRLAVAQEANTPERQAVGVRQNGEIVWRVSETTRPSLDYAPVVGPYSPIYPTTT